MTDGYDDALRARLSATDPARSLPPVDADRVTRLLEDTMHTDAEQETVTGEVPTRESGTRGRNPLTWLVAAAAIALIAAAVAFGVLRHDTAGKAPVAGGPQTVTELSAPGTQAYHARCMVPTPAALSRQSVAFDGTVRSIAGEVVTLVPRHFYTGAATDLVRVHAPQADLRALVTAVRFQHGGRYLVSATGGRVTICGFSAPWSRSLAATYHRAFEGG